MSPEPTRPGKAPAPEPFIDAAATTTGASTLAGGAWTSLAYGLPQIYTLVMSVVAARFLGPEGMGQQSFIAWAGLSMAMLLTTGLAGTLQRFVAEMLGRGRPDRAMALLRAAWHLAFGFALVGGGVLIAIGVARGQLSSAWALAGVACAASVLHSVPHSLLLGHQRYRMATMAGLVTGGVGVVATVTVLALGGGITGMFAVEACLAAVTLAWLSRLSHATVAQAPPPAPLGDLRGVVLRYGGYATFVGVLGLVVERRSEFLALEAFSDAEQIAFYSIAFGAVAALVRLVEGAAAPVVPAVATLFGAGDTDRIASGVARAVRLMVLVSVPATAAALSLGGPAIELVYGSEYAEAEPVLLIMAGVFPLLALFNLGGAVLDGIGRIRLIVIGMVVASIVDVALAVLLIPGLDALGAAIANAGAQTVGAVLLLVFLRRVVGRLDVRPASLLPVVAVSSGAGAAAWLVAASVGGAAAFLAAAPIFGVVFVLLALALRPLPKIDANWMVDSVGHLLGGRFGRVCAQMASRG